MTDFLLPRAHLRTIGISVLFICSIQTPSFAQVTIEDIRVLSGNYSSKTLSAQYNYDGEYGAGLSLGVIALTTDRVRGSGFRPTSISSGTGIVTFTVNKPTVAAHAETISDRLNFRFYGGSTDFNIIQNFELLWEDIDSYFAARADNPAFESIKNLALDEAVENSETLYSNILNRGVRRNEIQIYDSSYGDPSTEGLTVRFAEDIVFDDIKAVLTSISEAGMSVRDLGFISISDPNYEQGQLRISTFANTAGSLLNQQSQQALLNATSASEIYRIVGFQATEGENIIDEMLATAVRLNDTRSLRDARDALELARAVLEREPANIAAYIEHARAEFAIPNGAARIPSARNTMELALNLEPNNPFALHYAGFLEMELDQHDRALVLFQLAQQNITDLNQLVWLIADWGQLLEVTGNIDQGIERYKELLALDRSQLDARNLQAVYYGLRRYSRLLEAARSAEIDPIYQILLQDTDVRSQCIPVTYAMYILRSQKDLNKAREALSRAERFDCDESNLVSVLIDVVNWQQQAQSQADLYQILLRYSERPPLLYRAANLDNGRELVRVLGENGIDLDSLDAEGNSAILLAMADNNSYAIGELVAGGADVDRFNDFGFNPLFQAILDENVEMVRALIDSGASTEIENEFGYSALMFAEEMGNSEILIILQSSGRSNV